MLPGVRRTASGKPATISAALGGGRRGVTAKLCALRVPAAPDSVPYPAHAASEALDDQNDQGSDQRHLGGPPP